MDIALAPAPSQMAAPPVANSASLARQQEGTAAAASTDRNRDRSFADHIAAAKDDSRGSRGEATAVATTHAKASNRDKAESAAHETDATEADSAERAGGGDDPVAASSDEGQAGASTDGADADQSGLAAPPIAAPVLLAVVPVPAASGDSAIAAAGESSPSAGNGLPVSAQATAPPAATSGIEPSTLDPVAVTANPLAPSDSAVAKAGSAPGNALAGDGTPPISADSNAIVTSSAQPMVSGASVATLPAPLQPAVAAPAPPILTLHTPVSASHWGQELGSQVQWLASQGAHTAELRLNPPDLGPLEVRISSDGVSSSVQFFATNNVVRDAVEAALPRLRELFVQQGLQLSGADVSGQAMAEQRSREQFGAGTQGQSSSWSYAVEQDDLGDGALAAPVSSPGRIGLVDYYA